MAPVPARRSTLQGVGQPVLRKVDRRLVTGAGCYSDDVVLPGQAHAAFDPLPAVTGPLEAPAAGAALVWDDAGSNVCVDSIAGDAAAVDAAFARAAHVVRLDTQVNRVTGAPMEPRAALGAWDTATGRFTVYAGSGGSWRIRSDVAGVLGVPEASIRVVARDVGGNYGTRNSCYPEYALVAWAARRLGRPVKWTGDRREMLLTDYQSRDLVWQMELALDAEGNFLAVRGTNTSNVGAHAVSFIPLAKGVAVSASVYHVPVASMGGRAVLSHTAPTTPYRAAGRPEVMFVIERLIDLAARRHGFDRVALRRRNLVPASAVPYRNPLGLLYDSGDYAAAQDRAVALSDWAGFEARRREARRRRRYRGIGLGNYIELNTGMPRERAEITVRPEGRIDVVIGTLSAGQGHETSFAQLIAEWFDVEVGQVRLITGDTDVASVGGGSHSGRSMRLAGVVMAKASDQIVDKGRRIAAWLLEAAETDLDFSESRFTVRGTDRGVHLFAAAAAALRADAPETLRGPLAGAGEETMSVPSYPYGATGQMQSAATFMDYALPRADLFPPFATEISEVPSTSNPLGLRGGGEGGTTPALGAVINAIVDALAELGVEHIEMPATPERVWRAIQDARR